MTTDKVTWRVPGDCLEELASVLQRPIEINEIHALQQGVRIDVTNVRPGQQFSMSGIPIKIDKEETIITVRSEQGNPAYLAMRAQLEQKYGRPSSDLEKSA